MTFATRVSTHIGNVPRFVGVEWVPSSYGCINCSWRLPLASHACQ